MLHYSNAAFSFQNRRESKFISAQYTVHDLLSGHLLRVPHYQRIYRWQVANVTALVDDIVALYESELSHNGEGASTHFLTQVMLHQKTENGRTVYDIVDGQQRITTIYLFLAALRSQISPGDTSSRTQRLRLAIDGLLFSADSLETGRPVTLMQHSLPVDRATFGALCTGDVAQAKQGNPFMVKAYQAMVEFVRAHAAEKADRPMRKSDLPSPVHIEHLYMATVYGLDMMTVTTKDSARAQRAYLDINSKGVPLPTMDLVRAAFAGNIDEAAFAPVWQIIHGALDTHNPDSFLQHWIQARTGTVATKANLHKVFLRLLYEGKMAADLATLDTMARDAQRYAMHSKGMDIQGRPVDGLHWANNSSLRQHRPLLIAAGHLEQDMPELFHKLCEEIARTALVTSTGKIQTNQMSAKWDEWTLGVRTVRTKSEMEVFLDDGLRAFRADICPDLEALIARLGDSTSWDGHRPRRNDRQTAVLSYFAYAVEKRQGRHGGGAAMFEADQTVEHIIPISEMGKHSATTTKDEFRKKVAAIGNLTLLTDDENKRAGAKPVAEKIAIYADSSFAITRASVRPTPVGKKGHTAEMLRILPFLNASFSLEDVDARTAGMAQAIARLLVEPVA